MDQTDPAAAHEKKKKVAVIGVSALVLVAMVAAVGVGVSEGPKKSGDSGVVTSNRAIKDICQPTDYKKACEESLATSAAADTSDPIQLVQTAFHVAVRKIQAAVANTTAAKKVYNDPNMSGAIEICREVTNYAIGDLDTSIKHMGQIHVDKVTDFVDNLKIWLSSAINYQQTCLDAFENTPGEEDSSGPMKKLLNSSMQLTSNGLAMATQISSVLSSFDLSALQQSKRRLLVDGLLPPWADHGRRRLLAEEVKADVVVAKDGSGKYKTVSEALRDVPLDGGNKTFVIRIKEGVYEEKVHVGASMKNVVLIGDGPTKTKITGRHNLAEGILTYRTATVAVKGEGFVAKDIGIENTAGPEKKAAVALLVQSDHAIFQNCQIDGDTNTLYALNYRQFFRDCTVSGAVDFITGDASAVFQNCRLVVRRPNTEGDAGDCYITAQTRSDKREPSAFVLQNCTVVADPNYLSVKERTKSYLGRPKKKFSNVVFMESQLDVIDPDGWSPFSGDFGMDTCFLAEYKSRGAGAGQDKRVKWPGIQHLDPDMAEKFTPAKFIGGDTWIKPSGVPYVGGMMNIE